MQFFKRTSIFPEVSWISPYNLRHYNYIKLTTIENHCDKITTLVFNYTYSKGKLLRMFATVKIEVNTLNVSWTAICSHHQETGETSSSIIHVISTENLSGSSKPQVLNTFTKP